MPVVASSLIDQDSAATPDQLWGLSRLLLCDWGQAAVALTSNYPVSISLAQSTGEQRRLLDSKPQRSLTATLVSTRPREAWQLLNGMKRQAMARSLVPLYCDYTETTVIVDTGLMTPTVYCDTTNRRFQVGGRIVIATERDREDVAALNFFEVAVIATVTDDHITLTTSLSRAYPVSSRVYPLIEAHVILQQSMQGTGDEYATLALAAKEVEGPSALLPTVDDSGDTIFTTFEGIPCFDAGVDDDGGFDYGQAIDHGFLRDGSFGSSGNATTFLLGDGNPRNAIGHPLLAFTRAKAFDWIRFYDSVRGTLRPFVAISPFSLYEVYDIPDSTHLRIYATGPLSDYDVFPLLAIRFAGDGPSQTEIRRITSVTRSSGLDTLVLAVALVITDVTKIIRATVAAVCRFNGPLVENWAGDELVNFSLPALEVFDAEVKVDCILGCDQPPGGPGEPGGPTTDETLCDRADVLAKNGSTVTVQIDWIGGFGTETFVCTIADDVPIYRHTGPNVSVLCEIDVSTEPHTQKFKIEFTSISFSYTARKTPTSINVIPHGQYTEDETGIIADDPKLSVI